MEHSDDLMGRYRSEIERTEDLTCMVAFALIPTNYCIYQPRSNHDRNTLLSSPRVPWLVSDRVVGVLRQIDLTPKPGLSRLIEIRLL